MEDRYLILVEDKVIARYSTRHEAAGFHRAFRYGVLVKVLTGPITEWTPEEYERQHNTPEEQDLATAS